MQIIVLNREQVKASLNMREVLCAVEAAYRMKAAGKTGVWPLVSHEFQELGAVMDIRSGFVGGDVNLHGLKMLNNFPGNAARGLPVFNGMLMLFDSATGLLPTVSAANPAPTASFADQASHTVGRITGLRRGTQLLHLYKRTIVRKIN